MWARSRKIAPAPVDIEDRIVAELRCIKCGVILRGSYVSAPCPHCGHPCSDSVYGDYLIYADRAEIDRLDEATQVVIYAGVLTALIITAAIVAMVVTSSTAVEAIRRAFETLFAGALVVPVIATTGIVLLTRRYSVEYYEAKYFHQRVLIRAGLVVCLVLIALSVAARFLPHTVQTCLLAAWATVPPAAFLRGVARLMRRMPNAKLAAFARGICAGVWVVGALTLVFGLLRPLAVEQADWEGPMIALQFITTCGWIGIGIAAFRLLLAIHRNLLAIRH